MKAGRASQTAELVCMGRAVAHARASVPGFEDATALPLLPAELQARVARALGAAEPAGWRAKLERGYLRRQSTITALRTLAIDRAVREATATSVILGAGLDGRAWRLPELAGALVFEVDHPDSQADKRARVAALAQRAREVRFLPVDFARDSLADALSRAGHDAAERTLWIWEGVVMYLTPAEVEATLTVIAARSAPGSRLCILYHAPHWMLKLVGLVVRRVGEPLRSAFRPAQMRALLAHHGFRVVHDGSVHELGLAVSAELGRAAKVGAHLRLVTAEKGGTGAG